MLAWNMFYSTSYPIFVETTTAVKIKRSRTVIWGLNNTNNNCTTKYKHARPVEEIPMSYGRCWVRNLPILWIYSTQRGFNSHIMNWNGHISIYHTYRLYCSWLIWLNSFGCYSAPLVNGYLTRLKGTEGANLLNSRQEIDSFKNSRQPIGKANLIRSAVRLNERKV